MRMGWSIDEYIDNIDNLAQIIIQYMVVLLLHGNTEPGVRSKNVIDESIGKGTTQNIDSLTQFASST